MGISNLSAAIYQIFREIRHELFLLKQINEFHHISLRMLNSKNVDLIKKKNIGLSMACKLVISTKS